MTRPAAGRLEVRELSTFADNYIWLLLSPEERRCAVGDPGDAQLVLDWLSGHSQWTLSHVLITSS